MGANRHRFKQVCWSYCVTDWGTEIRPKSDSKKSFLVRCLRYEFLSSCHVTLLNKVSHPQLLRCGTARSERPHHRLWPIKQRLPSCFICRVFISLYSSYMLTFSLNFISCSHSCAQQNVYPPQFPWIKIHPVLAVTLLCVQTVHG